MKTVPLGDIAEFINGAAFKPEDWGEEGARIIRIQNLNDPSKPYNRTTREVAEKYLVPPGTLLVSWSASLGVFEWNELDTALLNQHIFKVVPNTRIVRQDYLRIMLVRALDEMAKFAHGSTMQHVNRGEFLATTIPLPPLEEQKRIAAILDQADELRRKRQRALDRLNQLGQAIFIDMFGDPAYGEANAIELSGLLTVVTSGGRGWSQYYAESGTRFVRSLDVQMNSISSRDAAFVNAPDNAEARRTTVQPGDVLLTITGSKIGRVAPVPPDFGPAFVSQHVAILRVDCMRLLPEFLSYYLSLSNGGQRQIAKHQYGQTKPGLNFDQIGRFLVPDVAIERQREFVRAITQIDAISAHATNAQLRDDQLFASLQSLAFRGELTASRLKEAAA